MGYAQFFRLRKDSECNGLKLSFGVHLSIIVRGMSLFCIYKKYGRSTVRIGNIIC